VPYARTTWQANRAGGTGFTAGRMNNIEQGLVDLYAYKGAKKKLDFNGTTWDLTGLDGAAHVGYDITAWGLYAATSAECAAYLTALTPAQTDARSQGMYTLMTNAGASTNSVQQTARTGVGVWLGSTYDQPNGRNFVMVKFSILAVEPTSGNADRLVMGESMFRSVGRPAGTPGHELNILGGYLETGAGDLTGVQFHWDNAALVGSVLVEPWVGSF
jgi:hypothetical protein